MKTLLDAVTSVACLVSPEKVQAISSLIRRTEANKALPALSHLVGTPTASAVIKQLVDAWKTTSVSADELASMLLAARHVVSKTEHEQSTELVWTGPTTPFVSARRTEQALLQVINASNLTLFVTSFVAYDVFSIVDALNDAGRRGVQISILLESSQAYGGSVTIDAIGKMKTLVPSAQLYAWNNKEHLYAEGKVHAKVAVSDGVICFITSANLTGYAMEKNIEAGILIKGGDIPLKLDQHLYSLIATKIITPVEPNRTGSPLTNL